MEEEIDPGPDNPLREVGGDVGGADRTKGRGRQRGRGGQRGGRAPAAGGAGAAPRQRETPDPLFPHKQRWTELLHRIQESANVYQMLPQLNWPLHYKPIRDRTPINYFMFSFPAETWISLEEYSAANGLDLEYSKRDFIKFFGLHLAMVLDPIKGGVKEYCHVSSTLNELGEPIQSVSAPRNFGQYGNTRGTGQTLCSSRRMVWFSQNADCAACYSQHSVHLHREDSAHSFPIKVVKRLGSNSKSKNK